MRNDACLICFWADSIEGNMERVHSSVEEGTHLLGQASKNQVDVKRG
jgi:hypothetical protein